MRQLLVWLKETYTNPSKNPASYLGQGIVHLVQVYAIGRLCVPWLIVVAHDRVLPHITGHPAEISPQFLYSHLFVFSIVLGLVAGFLNAMLFRRKVVLFVWVVPVTVLCITFVFKGPGMYPTMIWDSNFKEAAHFFFDWNFHIPDYNSYAEMRTDVLNNVHELIRGTAQLHDTVPAFVGIAYSLGAWLSLHLNYAKQEPFAKS
jgi:hypothetical protein